MPVIACGRDPAKYSNAAEQLLLAACPRDAAAKKNAKSSSMDWFELVSQVLRSPCE